MIICGDGGNGWYTKLFSFTVNSSLRVKLCWVSIWLFCYWMFLWRSCFYGSLLSAQLRSRLLSRCLPKRVGGATKEFQSERKGVLVPCSSRYLSSRCFGKFVENVIDGVRPVTEGVFGNDRFSGDDKEVFDEMSFASLTKSGKTWKFSNLRFAFLFVRLLNVVVHFYNLRG